MARKKNSKRSDELYAEQKKLARRANQRIKNLENKGYANELASINSLTRGKGRFTTTRGTNQQMLGNIRRIKAFLGYKSSTIKGFEKMFSDRINHLSNKYAQETGGKVDVESWDKFLRSDEFKQAMKLLDSETVMMNFQQALNDNIDVDKIIESYNEFTSKEKTYDDMYKDLTGRNPFL